MKPPTVPRGREVQPLPAACQGGTIEAKRTMAEIDFGKLVSRVLARMDDTESNLTGGERRDTGKALRHYKQALAEEIREVFDEAEVAATVAREPVPCTRCGAILEERGRFCTVCGKSQTEEAPGDFRFIPTHVGNTFLSHI